jgi:hypothetical protein
MSGMRVMLITLLACTALLACDKASAQPRTEPKLEDPATPTAAADVWLRRMVGRFQFEGLVEVVYYPPEDGHRCAALPPDPKEAESDKPPKLPQPWCSAIKGMGDCVAIGTGPGVQCVLNVKWQDFYEVVSPEDLEPDEPAPPVGVFTLPGGASYLDPAMALYGLDPGKSAINFLLVDSKGLPEGTLGLIKGNRATFKTPCVNAAVLLNAMKPAPPETGSWRTCERTLYIDAKPDAKLVFMTMDIEINDDIWTRFTMSLRRVAEVPAIAAKP